MKKLTVLIFSLILILYSCQPLNSLQIDTISPSQIDFPGAYNKIMFINLDNDLNNDNEIDTVLHQVITNEMILGFYDGFKLTPSIDSSRFLINSELVNPRLIYNDTSINWRYLNQLNNQFGVDIIILLDSLSFIMDSGTQTGYFEYYKYRELSINAFWKVLDVYENKVIDTYMYSDTLLWDRIGMELNTLEKSFPSLLQSVKEVSYFAALDYSKRIFPIWKTETRYFFIEGNKQFKSAAGLANSGNWKEASEIWKLYVKSTDKELASRATYNLAVADEILGNIDRAIQWAQISYDIKEKTRTKYYILKLKRRKSDIEKLKIQL